MRVRTMNKLFNGTRLCEIESDYLNFMKMKDTSWKYTETVIDSITEHTTSFCSNGKII